MSAFIKMFSTCTGKYFYDVGKNQIVKIDDTDYKYLLLYKKIPDDIFFEKYKDQVELRERIQQFTEKGFLSNKKPNRIIHPYTYIVEDLLSKKLHTAILQVTQMCNLKCRYCPYSGNGYLDRKHLNRTMSIEVAQKTIDFIVSNSLFSNDISIGFYGGEPLIAYDFIKETVEYTQKVARGKNINFFITTNGTILSRKIIKFLSENNFSVTVSLDGPEAIHDKNRRVATSGKGSFHLVYNALKTIVTEYPDFVAKIGINAVWDMEESYDDIMDFFSNDPVLSRYQFSVTPVDNTITDTDFSMSSYNFHEQQLNQMLALMADIGIPNLSNNDLDKSTLKAIENFQAALEAREEIPDECHFGGMCVPGYNRLFVDVDGNFLPCEKVSSNSKIAKIGDVFNGFDMKKVKKVMNIGAIGPNDCKTCWCGQFCTCCFKFVDDLYSMSYKKRSYECKQIQRSVLRTMKEYVVLKESEKIIKEIN